MKEKNNTNHWLYSAQHKYIKIKTSLFWGGRLKNCEWPTIRHFFMNLPKQLIKNSIPPDYQVFFC